MARTFRRSADFARRHLLQQDAWDREDAALGRPPFAIGPRRNGWGWPEWELVTDNFGADSAKPFKRANIIEHTSSVRRFVKDALTRGEEPIVFNERSRWYAGVGVVGTTVPIHDEPEPEPWPEDPIVPPNTMCGCGEALATVAIEFSADDIRYYCHPCS